MKTPVNYWKRINFQFDRNIENSIRQQHIAAQLIALVGRYLVPQKPDLSNINMKFLIEKEMLLGNPLENGIQLGLHLSNLEIHIINPNNKTLATIQLNKKTFEFALAEIQLTLSEEGVDVSKLKNEQPYSLSTAALKNERFFTSNVESLKSATTLRHNAEIILSELAAKYKDAIPVRIWPHYFDTGTFFATARNPAGEVSQTIGMGWAIPDDMIHEPYFYISFWSEQELKNTSKLKALNAGKWMTPGWKGAVLPHSEILKESSAQNQHLLVKQFFHEGVSTVSHRFKK